ncbi:hypothetical protein Y032_0015g2782 [Ancylostoma ceylanicum]|uniref:Uncharacterized protein n=1 Tax=Ancylostoma ceylanicum TaxID=53326 RepID=A0A016V9K1_9BILA|nr:hypothetical protein Y032_0015g2782 [Ancylostoma ceylanicum]
MSLSLSAVKKFHTTSYDLSSKQLGVGFSVTFDGRRLGKKNMSSEGEKTFNKTINYKYITLIYFISVT